MIADFVERDRRPSQFEVLRMVIAQSGSTETDVHIGWRHFREESLLYAQETSLSPGERALAEYEAYAIAEVTHALTHKTHVDDVMLGVVAHTAVWSVAEMGRPSQKPLLQDLTLLELTNARRVLYRMTSLISRVMPRI